MKSKEEILRTHLGSIWSHQDFDALGKYVYAAMDEYASQQAPPTTKELIEDCEREGEVLKKRVEELQAPEEMYTTNQNQNS